MKKWSVVIITFSVISIILLTIGVYVFYNKLYYPPLPIDGISQREAIVKLEKSNDNLVLLTSDSKTHWYISNKAGINVIDRHITELVGQYGWQLETREGAALIFTQADEKLITTTRMWTRNYMIIKIPVNVSI